MTFANLAALLEKYKIPKDVTLQSDSGWEVDATDMDGIYYSKATNTIVFTQDFCKYDRYYNNRQWKKLR